MTPDGIVERIAILLGVQTDKASFQAADANVAGLTAVVASAAAVFARLVVASAEAGDQMLGDAKKAQVSVETLGELRHVADDLGASQESVGTALRFLSRNLSDAAEKAGPARDALAALGITMEDVKGLGVDKVLEVIAGKFSGLETDAKRTDVAMTLFGRGGAELIPVLSAGSDEIQRLRKEAQDLGIVMSTDAAEAGDQLNDTLGRLKAAAGAAALRIGFDLIPAVQRVADRVEKWWLANRAVIVQGIDRTMGDIAKAVDALNSPLGEMLALITAIGAARFAWSLMQMVPALGAVSAALAPIAAMAAVGGGLYLLADDLRGAAEGADSLSGRVAKALGVGSEFDVTMKNIGDMFAGFSEAAPHLFDGMAEGAKAEINALIGLFPDWLVNLFSMIGSAGSAVAGGALDWAGSKFAKAASGFAAYSNVRRRAVQAGGEVGAGTAAADLLARMSLRQAFLGNESLLWSDAQRKRDLVNIVRGDTWSQSVTGQANVTISVVGDQSRLPAGFETAVHGAVLKGLLDAQDDVGWSMYGQSVPK